VTIRYVIDRLCVTTGSASQRRVCSPSPPLLGAPCTPTGPVTPPSATVYRLSVRVSGARNTQVFLQTTFSMPGT
jgi:type IV pilus assembly protein PilX